MTDLALLILVFGWISSALIIGLLSKKIYPHKSELSRKIVHIATGPIIPLAWILGIQSNLAIAISSIITIGLLLNYFLRIIPTLEDVNRNSYGTVAYGLSITLLIILFWPEQAAAVTAAVLVMAFADGLAGLIGREIKSPNWRIWKQKKSLLGTITMGLVTALVLIGVVHFSGETLIPWKILLATIMSVTLEQISRWGIDNITVPFGIAYSWSWMINN